MATDTLINREILDESKNTVSKEYRNKNLDISVLLSEEQKQDLLEMADYVSELTSSKDRSVDFLKRAGILNVDGDLDGSYQD